MDRQRPSDHGLLFPRRIDLARHRAIRIAEDQHSEPLDFVQFGGLEHLVIEAVRGLGPGALSFWDCSLGIDYYFVSK